VWLLDVIAGDRKAATAVLANFRQLSGERAVKIRVQTDLGNFHGTVGHVRESPAKPIERTVFSSAATAPWTVYHRFGIPFASATTADGRPEECRLATMKTIQQTAHSHADSLPRSRHEAS